MNNHFTFCNDNYDEPLLNSHNGTMRRTVTTRSLQGEWENQKMQPLYLITNPSPFKKTMDGLQ